uniref:Interferon lambda 1 n=1 Tax=Balaenoptera musculus TaxID=9771 RepID=A0A8C0E3P4_BALMU
MAADLMLVLVTTMGLGLARACPVPTTTRKGCGIGMFKSLLPSELVAFKKAKDGNSLKDWNCSSRLFPRTRDLKQLQVSWESQARLVLGTVANSSLDHILDQPLHTLHHIHSKFQACVSAQGTGAPGPRSCFQYWLHRLQEAPEKVSDPGRGWMPGPWARRRLTPGNPTQMDRTKMNLLCHSKKCIGGLPWWRSG